MMLAKIIGDFPGQLLKVGQSKCAARSWVYTNGLGPPKDFGLLFFIFNMTHLVAQESVISSKNGCTFNTMTFWPQMLYN